MNILEKVNKYLGETKETPNAYDVLDQLKKFEPYKKIQSSSQEKMFITKAKKYFKKIGIEEWKLNMAIEDFRKKNTGNVMVYLDPESLVRMLIKNGDLDSTKK